MRKHIEAAAVAAASLAIGIILVGSLYAAFMMLAIASGMPS